MHMAMTDHPLRIVHEYAMTAADARELARLVARQSKTSLEKLPGVSKRRAETLPYAALVLDGLIEALGLKSVTFSAWGVREGLLYAGLSPEMAAVDPLLAGCSAWGGRQGVDPALPRALDGWQDLDHWLQDWASHTEAERSRSQPSSTPQATHPPIMKSTPVMSVRPKL